MEGQTFWPPETCNVSNLIKMQRSPDVGWKKFDIVVMRFYETYASARKAVSKFIEDSNYETDQQEQPIGKRRRIHSRPPLLESDSDEEIVVRKRAMPSIPAPPPVRSKSPEKSKPAVSATKKKIVKGQAESKQDVKRRERKELIERLKAAREAAAAKMNKSTNKSLSPSPWKVTPRKDEGPKDKAVPCNVASPKSMASNPDSPDPLDFCEVQITTPAKSSASIESTTPLMGRFSEISSPENSPTQTRSLLRRDKSFYFTPPHKKSLPAVERESFDTVETSGGQRLDNFSSSRTMSSITGSSCRNLFEIPSNEGLKQVSTASGRQGSGITSSSAGSSCRNLFQNSNNESSKEQPSEVSIFSGRVGSLAHHSALSSMSSNKTSTLQNKSPGDNIRDDNSEKRLALSIVELSSKVDILMMNVARIARSLMPGEKRLSIPKNMPKLPLDSKKALRSFEKFLQETDVNLAATVDYMSNYVRTNVIDPERKSAYSVLGKLLTNGLAKQCNLEGGNDKVAFRKLELYKVFQGTLQSAFPQSDLTTADNALQKWLKDAKCRKQASPVAA